MQKKIACKTDEEKHTYWEEDITEVRKYELDGRREQGGKRKRDEREEEGMEKNRGGERAGWG